MKITTRTAVAASLACAVAAHGAQAQSSVALYGQVDATVASRQLSGGTRTTLVNDGGLSTSHFGLRGTEDLGDGWKAQLDLSGFFTVDTGATGRFAGSPDGLLSRRATVGLSGPFGQLDIGRIGSPYFFSMIMFNPYADSAVYSPVFLHTYSGGQFPLSAPPMNGPDSGVSNAIQYGTPSYNGVSARLLYAPGEVAGDAGKRRVSANVHYLGPALALTLAFERDSTALGTLGTLPNPETRQQAWLGGITYDFGSVKLYAQREQITQVFNAAGTNRKYTIHQLGAAVPLGAGKVLLSWAHSAIDLPPAGVSPYTVVPGFPALPAGVATSGVDPVRNTATLGYDYNLSRRTDAYALLMLDRYTGLASGKSVALGIRHRF
ncbi:MAG: porin [Pseudomonadota bacterium]